MQIAPITEVDIARDQMQERLWAMSYHKGVVDFAKWTSALATAAMLWVGNSLGPASGSMSLLMIASAACLISSLVFAIAAVRRVLRARAAEWRVATEGYSFSLMKKFKAYEPGKITEEEERERINRLLDAIEDTGLIRNHLASAGGLLCM